MDSLNAKDLAIMLIWLCEVEARTKGNDIVFFLIITLISTFGNFIVETV